MEAAFADIGGWDTHFNQVGGKLPAVGTLANQLSESDADWLPSTRIWATARRDVVVTMSEFGRTAKENGTRGTDHGHATVGVRDGRQYPQGGIHGEWPGMQTEQLYENRDLNITTDFPGCVERVGMSNHLGNRQLSAVFPGYTVDAKKYRGVVAARGGGVISGC